ncbi:hypothetical protein ACFYT4_22210 [Streptomyces sp. NPDC004609]|uniref:hypothetical protein n=1 Tax=Streptomyces sp. NPDC004609 TaxID=3364704 RepID=UPI003695E2D5
MQTTDSEAMPAYPSEPRPGQVVWDAARDRVGRVMGTVGGYVQLRPLRGGREWDAHPEDLRPAVQSDAMSKELAEVNCRSREVL